MFYEMAAKHAHELKSGETILWESHYYQVLETERISPSMTGVTLDPIDPLLPRLKTFIHSDLLVRTYDWRK